MEHVNTRRVHSTDIGWRCRRRIFEHVSAVPIDFERQLTFEGCFNFRDVGGYATVQGRQIRARRLYRADGPHALTERDTTVLQALELRTVIDLRTPNEIAERGRYISHLADAIAYELPMIDVLPDTEELPRWSDPAVVAQRYAEMLDGAHDAIAETLAILTDPGAYPAMFHCSAGKDRTGIVAAIVLGILGVADETIVADYTLSEPAMVRLVDYFKRAHPDARLQLTQLTPAIVAAQADTMRLFLGTVRARYGTFDDLAERLGVGSAPRFLRAELLL